ncbi:MAG: pilus assembly protein TadG-related protein [Hyphomicrobiaceae bacterium]
MIRDARRRSIAGFGSDAGGSVAIIFAAVIIPVIGIVAAAIDYGRAAKVRSTLETAVSAAAQSASQHLGENRSVIESKVAAMLAANLPTELARLPHRLRIANDNSSVEVAMEARVPTTLMGVVGVPELTASASGFAKPPELGVAALASGSGVLPESSKSAAAALGPAPVVIRNQEDLRAAAASMAKQLEEMASGVGGSTPALPPEAAAQLERMMRDLRRNSR